MRMITLQLCTNDTDSDSGEGEIYKTKSISPNPKYFQNCSHNTVKIPKPSQLMKNGPSIKNELNCHNPMNGKSDRINDILDLNIIENDLCKQTN